MAVDALPADFPQLVIHGPWFGQWWRIHRRRDDGGTAWWFASSDDGRPNPGRFDLPLPLGTCYVAAFDVAAGAEVASRPADEDAETQRAWDALLMSQMPLDRWFGARIADFAGDGVVEFGGPPDIGVINRDEARPWAVRAQRGGYCGMHFRLGRDPQRRPGLALFGRHGDHPPPFLPAAQPLPVGARHALRAVFAEMPPEDPLAL